MSVLVSHFFQRLINIILPIYENIMYIRLLLFSGQLQTYIQVNLLLYRWCIQYRCWYLPYRYHMFRLGYLKGQPHEILLRLFHLSAYSGSIGDGIWPFGFFFQFSIELFDFKNDSPVLWKPGIRPKILGLGFQT